MSNLFFSIVNYHSSELIDRLLKSLGMDSEVPFEVVIVNNSDDDRQILELKSDRVHILEAGENLGFGRACNLSLDWIFARDSKAVVWLINPDTYFAKSTLEHKSPLEKAIALFKKYPNLSIVGTTVYDPSGRLTDAGGEFTPGTAALSVIDTLPTDCRAEYLPTDWVSGCSLLINLANFNPCPQFDPRYFLYYEDLDFCRRYAQQQHKIAIAPNIKVFHATSSITNRNLLTKYRHITYSYLIHIEKYGSLSTFILTNLRIFLNTIRLLIFKPQQGLGKLIGIYTYWYDRLIR